MRRSDGFADALAEGEVRTVLHSAVGHVDATESRHGTPMLHSTVQLRCWIRLKVPLYLRVDTDGDAGRMRERVDDDGSRRESKHSHRVGVGGQRRLRVK